MKNFSCFIILFIITNNAAIRPAFSSKNSKTKSSTSTKNKPGIPPETKNSDSIENPSSEDTQSSTEQPQTSGATKKVPSSKQSSKSNIIKLTHKIYKIKIKDKIVRILTRKQKLVSTFDLPAQAFYAQIHKNKLLVACGLKGLLIISLDEIQSPVLEKQIEKNFSIRNFEIKNNQLLVKGIAYNIHTYKIDKTSGDANNLYQHLLKKENEKKARSIYFSKKQIGKVIRVKRGYAVFAFNNKINLIPGDKIAIKSGSKREIFDPFAGKTIKRLSNKRVCVAVIDEIKGNQASIELGRGDAPQVGDLVYLSKSAQVSSLYLPNRQKNIHHLQMEIIPIIGSATEDDNLIFSSLFLLNYEYHFEKPLMLQFAIDPLQYIGGSAFSLGQRIGANFTFTLAYSTKNFGIGIGTGYQKPLLNSYASPSGFTTKHNRDGFLLVQYIRLGAIDGINLSIKFQSVYSNNNKENQTRAMIGNYAFRLSVPLSQKLNFFTRYFGDGRTMNHYSLGLKTFVGNGGPGTFAIPVSLGLATMSPYYYDDAADPSLLQYEVTGVVFSIGFERRF
ncbi:MAG: hypothetical protein ACQES9_12345 [Myxococcota bacterium]